MCLLNKSCPQDKQKSYLKFRHIKNCLYQAKIGSKFILKTWESLLFFGRRGHYIKWLKFQLCSTDFGIVCTQLKISCAYSLVVIRLWTLVYVNFYEISFVSHFTTLAELFSKWGDWTRIELVNSNTYRNWQLQ